MITSKQRAQLRAIANTTETIFQVGKSGIIDTLVAQMDDALRAREMIKIRVLESADVSAKEAAEMLAPRLSAEVVQVIGARVTLFRRNEKDPVIELTR